MTELYWICGIIVRLSYVWIVDNKNATFIHAKVIYMRFEGKKNIKKIPDIITSTQNKYDE